MPLDYDFQDDPSYWVGLTNHAIEHAVHDALEPMGVGLRQVQVLACLSRHGARSPVELAADMHLEPSTLTRVLGRMEREGWTERRPCPNDPRRSLISVTERVEPTWTQLVELGSRVVRTAVDGFSADELDTLRDLLERIRNNLEAGSSKTSCA